MYRASILALLSVGLLATTVGCARTPAVESQSQSLTATGEQTFRENCASCHGVDGTGEGPVADLLVTPAPNLTVLEQTYGDFPSERLYMIIDGRWEVEAHGPRDMPVWGEIWTLNNGQPVSEEAVEQKIDDLIAYIRTMQVEEGGD